MAAHRSNMYICTWLTETHPTVFFFRVFSFTCFIHLSSLLSSPMASSYRWIRPEVSSVNKGEYFIRCFLLILNLDDIFVFSLMSPMLYLF